MSGKPGNRLPAHRLIAAPAPGAPVPGERRALPWPRAPKTARAGGVRKQRGSLSSRGAGFPRRGRGPLSLEAALDLRLRNSLPNNSVSARIRLIIWRRATPEGDSPRLRTHHPRFPQRNARPGGLRRTPSNRPEALLTRKKAAGGCFRRVPSPGLCHSR